MIRNSIRGDKNGWTILTPKGGSENGRTAGERKERWAVMPEKLSEIPKIAMRQMEEKKIFRKKSLERVNSPEQLDDYIRVTTPSVWMILFATLILIAGTLFWAVFGKIQINTETGVKEVAPISYIIR